LPGNTLPPPAAPKLPLYIPLALGHVIDNEEWIAKFESSKSAVKYPGIEYATIVKSRMWCVIGRPSCCGRG
jgi:hypothetical protein